jgi:hypothetical protein
MCVTQYVQCWPLHAASSMCLSIMQHVPAVFKAHTNSWLCCGLQDAGVDPVAAGGGPMRHGREPSGCRRLRGAQASPAAGVIIFTLLQGAVMRDSAMWVCAMP